MIRLPIRRKLAIALVPPLVALFAVGFARVDETADRVAEVRRQTQLARAVIGPAGLITTLQNERTWPAAELIGSQDQVDVIVEGYEETRRQTDEAIGSFQRFVAGSDPVVVDAFSGALDGLDGIQAIRDDIDAFTGPRAPVPETLELATDVFGRYTALVAPFFDATTVVSFEVDADAELRQGIELADAGARLVEAMSLLLNDTITTGLLTPGGVDTHTEISRIAALKFHYDKEVAAIRDAGGPYAALAEELFPEDLDAQIQASVGTAITTSVADLDALVPSGSVVPYLEAVRARTTERAQELDDHAERERWLALVVLAGVLAAAVALTWGAGRSLTRPLQRLTSQARLVAGRALPDAVQGILDTPMGHDVAIPTGVHLEVPDDDELSDVAHALVSAHDAAVGLAVQQAVFRHNISDALVSLARRNQNLLARQLDLITQLETAEIDPDGLASLFRLDHLATRMRRNAESLLVLAGVDTPRYRATPVAALDVIRSAFGEVEGYDRIVLGHVEAAQVAGAASTDLAHIVAELLDNALGFSDPSLAVEVHGTRMGDGNYCVAVVDHGVGMPAGAFDEANRRLAHGDGPVSVAPSDRLGHLVAATLAARHHIEVRLRPTPRSGVTAAVVLPPALVHLPSVRPEPLPLG